MSEWLDISVPLRNRMPHWPGDIPVQVGQTMDMGRGDVCNLRTLSMSAHAGTHIDAPLHFVTDGKPIDAMPGDATIGPARVIEIADPNAITRDELERHVPAAGERLLCKTRNSKGWQRRCRMFVKDFVAVRPEAARYLVDCGIRSLGVDYLSVGAYGGGEGVETHRALLGAGIWVVEGLDLSAVDPGSYQLVCLPLRIEGGEGAPARAMLRRL
jgi:arylformamidase